MAKSKKAALPDAEIQAVADAALQAWDTGAGGHVRDSGGYLWVFQVERTVASGLLILRYPGAETWPLGDPPRETVARHFVGALELGVEDPRPLVASRIVATVAGTVDPEPDEEEEPEPAPSVEEPAEPEVEDLPEADTSEPPETQPEPEVAPVTSTRSSRR